MGSTVDAVYGVPMPTVKANGIDIHYEDEGSGEPILLVMGLGGQLIDWPERIVQSLVGAGFRVIRHDNRDVGLSQGFDWQAAPQWRQAAALITKRRIEAGYAVTDMADDAAHLLAALGIDSAHVAGASMGGMIAQSMAIHHPGKVRSMCSIMSNTGDRRSGGIHRSLLRKLARAKPPSRDNAAEYLTDQYELFAGSAWNKAEHLERTRRSIERAWRPAGTARQSAAIMASPDRTADLGLVTAPTLVVHGLQDRLVMPSGGIATAKAVPGSRLLMFPDMGHDMPASRNDEMVSAMVANAERARSIASVRP